MSNHIDGLPAAEDGSGAGDRPGANPAGVFAAGLRRFLCCNRGMAAVEFGLAAPILLAVLIPVADLGMAFSQEQQLRQAVQAGAQFAANQPSWDPGAITSAVKGVKSLSGIAAAAEQKCGCPAAAAGTSGNTVTTGGIMWVACGSTCAQGQTAGRYAVVSAQLPYKPILSYPVIDIPTTLTAQSIVRIG